jgi:ankyrin repeat protein
MLERIGPAVREDALTLLRWLAYSLRPIALAELQTAVTIRPEDDEVDFEDEGDFRDSLEILAGLVVFSDGADSTEGGGHTEYEKASMETGALTPGARIRLAHFSVKEYLESERISGSSASFFRLKAGACHRFLAQSCLTYLMCYSKSGEKESPKLDLNKFHLLNYAAHKWDEHSRLQSGDDVSREVALLECEDARIDWLQIGKLQFNVLKLPVRGPRRVPSICYAVCMHLSRVVKELLEAGQDANAVVPDDDPLLVTATHNEDLATVKLLLAHGADVDMVPTDGRGGNALWTAASRGLPLTKLLVDSGADVNFVSACGTALSAACTKSDLSVLRFLLERGARVNTIDRSGCTALITASMHGVAETVQLLVAKGADVNNPSTYITPLFAAAQAGRTDVMAILIDAGADVNAKTEGGRFDKSYTYAKPPPLIAAARLDCVDATAILIDAGADVNAQDSGALLGALLGGHERTVALLEARGAKELALHRLTDACMEVCTKVRDPHDRREFDPRQEIVTGLLLDRGANVNANASSALRAALTDGNQRLVALLEAKGAKKLTLDQLNEILIRVCSYGVNHHPERAVELLLDRGADVNAKDSSALLTALRRGNEGMVALLEAKGANKPPLEQLNQALIQVCNNRWHHYPEEAVQLLLDRGADVNAEDSSALLDALRSGHKDAVALLEAKGARKPSLKQLTDALIEVRGEPVHLYFERTVQTLLDRGADDNAASPETSSIE